LLEGRRQGEGSGPHAPSEGYWLIFVKVDQLTITSARNLGRRKEEKGQTNREVNITMPQHNESDHRGGERLGRGGGIRLA